MVRERDGVPEEVKALPSHIALNQAFALGFASRFQKGLRRQGQLRGEWLMWERAAIPTRSVKKNGRPLKRQRWAVDPATGCWIWLLAKHPRSGHGMETRNGKSGYAHRWAYLDAKGQISPGCAVLQTCRNHACINPEHLVAEKEPTSLNARAIAATRKKNDTKLSEAVRFTTNG
jgi:hypothetical protein